MPADERELEYSTREPIFFRHPGAVSRRAVPSSEWKLLPVRKPAPAIPAIVVSSYFDGRRFCPCRFLEPTSTSL